MSSSDGPIGAFQAIQHQLADLRVAVDAAELLTYRAACSMAEGRACAEEIALAKASADEMSRLSTVVGHGVYAGISYTVEHDMQLYSARNKLAEADGGGTLAQIDRIADFDGTLAPPDALRRHVTVSPLRRYCS